MRYNSAKSPRMTLMIYALALAAAAVAVLYCVFFETVLRFVIAALCLVVVAQFDVVRAARKEPCAAFGAVQRRDRL